MNNHRKISNAFLRKLWGGTCLFLVLILSMLSTAFLVRLSMESSPRISKNKAEIVREFANFPRLVKLSFYSIFNIQSNVLIDRSKVEKNNWVRKFPAADDRGYLLFSGIDPIAKHAIVSLIRISDGKEMARWDPDWPEIYKKITNKKWETQIAIPQLMAINPILLSDGAIIFNTSNAMIRLDAFKRTPTWILDEVIHHSNEIDSDGSIWAPGVAFDTFKDNPWLSEFIRDDALVRVSVLGKVLEKRSFSKILIDNGLSTLLFGHSGLKFNEDPIHLNQISIAPADTAYWKKGDLLVSARHLSTVFLYRPATNKIIWYQEGPWINQHSARFVDNHRISVFDNHVFGGRDYDAFIHPSDINRVLLYDFMSKSFSEPYAAMLKETKPQTVTGGLALVLPDGGLFIEETTLGRHLRFTKYGLLWSRVNDYDLTHIGYLAGSRYLTAEEVREPLLAIAAAKKAANN